MTKNFIFRYTQHIGKHGVGDAPNMENRTENQYWIFWPREAASKTKGLFRMGKEWDKSFNLTMSYRRDSGLGCSQQKFTKKVTFFGDYFFTKINILVKN